LSTTTALAHTSITASYLFVIINGIRGRERRTWKKESIKRKKKISNEWKSLLGGFQNGLVKT
jgi:hypothetical protein